MAISGSTCVTSVGKIKNYMWRGTAGVSRSLSGVY